MTEFKLTRKVVSYETSIVESESKEAGMRQYEDGEVEYWQEEYSEDEGLIAIDQRGENGEFSINFEVDEKGKFVEV